MRPISALNSKSPTKLYHLTASRKWKAIQKSRELKPFPDFMDYGVFFFDIDNAVNVWSKSTLKENPCKNCLQHLWDVVIAKVRPKDKLVLLEVDIDNLEHFKARDISLYQKAQKVFDESDIPLGRKISMFYPDFVGGINHTQLLPRDFDSVPLEFIYPGSVHIDSVKSVAQYHPRNSNTKRQRLSVENVPNQEQIKTFFEKLMAG